MSFYCNPIKDTLRRTKVVAVLQYFALHDYYKTNFDPERYFDEIDENFSLGTKLSAIMCNIGKANEDRDDVAQWITELNNIIPEISTGSVESYQNLITNFAFSSFYKLGTDVQNKDIYSIEITKSVKVDIKIMFQKRLCNVVDNPKYIVLNRSSCKDFINYPKNIILKQEDTYAYRLEGIITKEDNGNAMLYIHYEGNYAKFGRNRLRITAESFYEDKIPKWSMLFYERIAKDECDGFDTLSLKIIKFAEYQQDRPNIRTIIPESKDIKFIFRVLPGIIDDSLDYKSLPERELEDLNTFTENLLKIGKANNFGTNDIGKMNYDLIQMKETGKPSLIAQDVQKLYDVCKKMYADKIIDINGMVDRLNENGYDITIPSQNRKNGDHDTKQSLKDSVLQLDKFDWAAKADELDSSELVRQILKKNEI